MFCLAVFGVISLIVFKQFLLNINTFNHFKVVKCLQMTKAKHLSKVKLIENGYFLSFVL